MTTTSPTPIGRIRATLSQPRVRSVLLIGLFVALSIVYIVPNAWSVNHDGVETVSDFALTAAGKTTAGIVMLAGCVAVWWRSCRPVLFFTVCAIGYLVLSVLLGNRVLASSPALLYALFCMGRRVRWPLMAALVGVLIVIDTVVQCTLLGSVASLMTRLGIGATQAILLILLSSLANNAIFTLVGIGAALYDRRREASRELTRAQMSEHDANLREALAAERNRMARELHDMAAHHLTALIIETKAARRLQRTDPDTTAELLADITVQGQQTLDSMRSVVGILRQSTDDRAGNDRAEESKHMPQPTFGDVPALIDSARSINPHVLLDLRGDFDGYDGTVEVATYRIIQESLSNAHRHAPGAALRVTLRQAESMLVVTVTNGRPAIAGPHGLPGFGLAGMRERAAILGGSLAAGPTDDGGWRVRAELPLTGSYQRPTVQEGTHD